jgi:hypothetical protein
VVDGVPQSSSHCPSFSKDLTEDEFQDVDDEEGWWFMLQNQDNSPLNVKVEAIPDGKISCLALPHELPLKGQISVSLRYQFNFSHLRQSQDPNVQSTPPTESHSNPGSFHTTIFQQVIPNSAVTETEFLSHIRNPSGAQSQPMEIKEDLEISSQSTTETNLCNIFCFQNQSQSTLEKQNTIEQTENSQKETVRHSTLLLTNNPSPLQQSPINIASVSFSNYGQLCFELPFADFRLELNQSPKLRPSVKKKRPQRLCSAKRVHTEGFFHVDRQRSNGKTDFCVIHFANNQIIAIRLFLSTEKLPAAFRNDPNIAEALRKKKTRKIKFADDDHLAEVHYFHSRSPPALHFSRGLIDASISVDPDTLNIYELKSELRARNLPTKGKKKELIARLKETLNALTPFQSSSQLILSNEVDINNVNCNTNNNDSNDDSTQSVEENKPNNSVHRKRHLTEVEQKTSPKKQKLISNISSLQITENAPTINNEHNTRMLTNTEHNLDHSNSSHMNIVVTNICSKSDSIGPSSETQTPGSLSVMMNETADYPPSCCLQIPQ